MEDTSSLGGRSSSTDVASNVSILTTPEADASSRDKSDFVSPTRLEQEVEEGSEHELCGIGQQGQTGRSFSELSIGATAQDEIGAIQNETWVTPQNEAGVAQDGVGTIEGEAGATQDETVPTREETEALQDEIGATQVETGPTREETEALQDEIGATQDETGPTREETEAAPQDETGVAQDDIGATKDEVGATPDETGTTQEEIEATSQDESDDNIKTKPVSPDFKMENRPQSQKSLTGTDRRSAQQEKLAHDVLSGNQSPTERLSTSRQSQCEDVTSIRSADGSSLNASDSQYHTRSGSPAGCCCEQPGEQVKDELDAESGKVEVVATPVVIETVQLLASLEPRNESRFSSQDEPNVDKVGDAQLNNEELGEENTVFGHCCQQEAVEDVIRIQSPEEARQLKAEITSLQTRLQTVTKDNNEKGMRIVALESNLLEMTAKLLDVEKRCLPLEVSPSKRETSKSRTCAIL